MVELNDVFTALAHPSRRSIIKRLAAKGSMRFTDVAGPFKVNLNAVTKHLKLLDRAGLITREKKGREMLISLRVEPLRVASVYVHEYERFWNKQLDEFEQNFKKEIKK